MTDVLNMNRADSHVTGKPRSIAAMNGATTTPRREAVSAEERDRLERRRLARAGLPARPKAG